MLRTMIDGHALVRCYHELFNESRDPKFPRPHGFWKSRSSKDVLRMIWNSKNNEVKPVVGFVLHDSQESPQLSLYPYPHRAISAYPEPVKIIWHNRLDKMAQVTSLMIARNTNRWQHFLGETRVSVKPFKADVRGCVSWLLLMEKARRELKNMLGACESVDVTYEELCSDLGSARDRIFRLLGVPCFIKTAPKTTKVANYKHPSEILTNYDEIRRVLSDSGVLP